MKTLFKVNAFILTNLTSYTPKFQNVSHDWSVFLSLPLADPDFSSNQSIDMIVGAAFYPLILQEGLVKGPNNSIAQKKASGWIVICSSPSNSDLVRTSQHIATVHEQNVLLNSAIQKFWELESVPPPPFISLLSADDRACHQHFLNTYTRDETGRFIVKLPFKSYPPVFHGIFNKAKL